MSQELRAFVREALSRGSSREEIRATLRQAGWTVDAIEGSLAGFADVRFPVPVPRPRPYGSAKEAFAYLVLFSTLYASAFSLGSLLFGFIDFHWPDALAGARSDWALRSLRWSMSWLFIAFPVYLLLSYRTAAALQREPGKRASRVRKWLTYLTLFVAAGFLLGDVVTLVYNLLGGELTARFLLKVLSVGVLAGSVFGYYTFDLRRDDMSAEEVARPRPLLKALALGSAIGVAASLVFGFFLVGSPSRTRELQLDRQRRDHLASIARSIDLYWDRENRLPPDLDTLSRQRGVAVESLRDPETKQPYAYEIADEKEYRLCAVFAAPSPVEDERRPGPPGMQRFWEHGPGRHCFDVEVVEED